MFTKDEILAQLREGADANDIAQKMADEINAAIAAYSEEQTKASAKRQEAEAVVAAILQFLEHYYNVKREEGDVKKVTDLLIDACNSTRETIKEIEKWSKNKNMLTDDEILQKWIDKFN